MTLIDSIRRLKTQSHVTLTSILELHDPTPADNQTFAQAKKVFLALDRLEHQLNFGGYVNNELAEKLIYLDNHAENNDTNKQLAKLFD